MKKENGFTLVEILAVIVIIGILTSLAIPLVTGYINSSRKKLFMDDALTVADGVRNDLIKGGILNNNDSVNCVNGFCYYNLNDINRIMESKINKSSFGNDYTTGEAGVCVVINQNTNEVTMTMVDSGGNGFVDLVANTDDSKSIDSEKVNATGDIKASFAKIATKECTQTLREVYRWGINTVSLGDTLSNSDYETNPKRLEYYDRGFYLKHILDVNNKVMDSYVCYVPNNTEYCIHGGDTSYFSNNISVINSSGGSEQCDDSDYCKSLFSKFNVQAYSDGLVLAEGDGICRVIDNGTSSCDFYGVK